MLACSFIAVGSESFSFILSLSFSSLVFRIGKVLNPVCFIFKTNKWKLKSMCARGAGDIKADVPGASVLLLESLLWPVHKSWLQEHAWNSRSMTNLLKDLHRYDLSAEQDPLFCAGLYFLDHLPHLPHCLKHYCLHSWMNEQQSLLYAFFSASFCASDSSCDLCFSFQFHPRQSATLSTQILSDSSKYQESSSDTQHKSVVTAFDICASKNRPDPKLHEGRVEGIKAGCLCTLEFF